MNTSTLKGMDAAHAKRSAPLVATPYDRLLKMQGPVTYDDLRELPENLVGEIIDGDLYASPRPATRHARAAGNLFGSLFGFTGGPDGLGGWVILIEPELHLSGQVMVPDLAGWRRERMPEMPDAAFIELAPDWVCEVSSPSTAVLDRVRKMPHYARVGVSFMWIVDPIAKMVEVFRADGGDWQRVSSHGGDDETFRAEPFEADEFDLSVLWAR